MTRFYLFTLVLFLFSCDLASVYKRPEIKLIESENIEDNQNIDLISWQDFFDNQELKKLIALGLKNNRDLKIASLNIKSYEEIYKIQRSNILPKVNGEFSFRRQAITKNSTNFGFSGRNFIQNQYFIGASLSYEIDFFHKIRNLKGKALNEFLATKEAKKALTTSLIATISELYLNLSELKSRLKLSQKIIDINQNIYDLKYISFKNGISDKHELLTAKSNLEDAKSDYSAIMIEFEKTKNQLLYVINQQNIEELNIVDLADLKFSHQLPTNLSSEILLTRPDILSQEFELIAQNANIGAVRAAFFPSIALTSNYGFASAKYSTLFNSGSQGSWNFAPAINLPIFYAGENMANLKQAKFEQKIAAEKYLKTIENAFREVYDQIKTKKNLQDQLKSLDEKLKYDQEKYQLSMLKFNSGIINYIDQAQDEINFYQSQMQKNIALRNLKVSKVQFFKAIGGGKSNQNQDKKE